MLRNIKVYFLNYDVFREFTNYTVVEYYLKN